MLQETELVTHSLPLNLDTSNAVVVSKPIVEITTTTTSTTPTHPKSAKPAKEINRPSVKKVVKPSSPYWVDEEAIQQMKDEADLAGFRPRDQRYFRMKWEWDQLRKKDEEKQAAEQILGSSKCTFWSWPGGSLAPANVEAILVVLAAIVVMALFIACPIWYAIRWRRSHLTTDKKKLIDHEVIHSATESTQSTPTHAAATTPQTLHF